MTTLKRILATTAVAIPLALASWTAAAKNLVETAVDAGSFSTLVAAVQAADLAGTLSGPGPFTVFAPTDDAFAQLPAGTVEDLLKPENKDKLVAVLTYHVIPGAVTSSALAGKKLSATSVQGTDLAIDATEGVMVQGATVTQADIITDNGVIHVIDRVLLPM